MRCSFEPLIAGSLQRLHVDYGPGLDLINRFSLPKSDQLQTSPAASPEM